MAPSEKTVLRRVQRAGQRQRMREALARAAESEALATPEKVIAAGAGAARTQVMRPLEAKAGPQDDSVARVTTSQVTEQEHRTPPLDAEAGKHQVGIQSFIDSLLTTAHPSHKITAEEFVDQVCRLVDAYRAGLQDSMSNAVEPVPAKGPLSDALPCTTETNRATQPDACQVDVTKCEPEAVVDTVCCESRPVSSKSCTYTVRNTFIDLMPTFGDVKAAQTALFGTWPERTPSAAEERLHSDPTLSHRTGAPLSQLEAGEIVDDLEEGELRDDEEAFCDFSNPELCAFTTGNWESNYQLLEKCVAPCKMVAGDCFAKAGPTDYLKAETEGLNDLLRQSLNGYKGSLGACSQEANSPRGRWRKTNGETIDGSLTSAGDSSDDQCFGNLSSRCVLSLESALLGEQQQPGWFNIQPQIPCMPHV